jgi:hypothetical protein
MGARVEAHEGRCDTWWWPTARKVVAGGVVQSKVVPCGVALLRPTSCSTAGGHGVMAAVDRRSGSGAQAWSRAFNNSGKHPCPDRGEALIWIRRQQARIWAGNRPRRHDLDLQCRWLLLLLCVADGGLLPRHLDLGLAGSDSG